MDFSFNNNSRIDDQNKMQMDLIDFSQNSLISTSLNEMNDQTSAYSANHFVVRTNPNLKHGRSYNTLFPKEIWDEEGSDDQEFNSSSIKNRKIPLYTSEDEDTNDNEEYVEWSVKLSTSVDDMPIRKLSSDSLFRGSQSKLEKIDENLLSFDHDQRPVSRNKDLSNNEDIFLIDFEKSPEKIAFSENFDLITGISNDKSKINENMKKPSHEKNDIFSCQKPIQLDNMNEDIRFDNESLIQVNS